MSLLMKALEKAAKDRLDTKAGNAVAAAGTPPAAVIPQAAAATHQATAGNATKSELTLEPIVAQGVAPAAAPAPSSPQAARARTPATPNAAPAAAPAAASREPAEAVAMVRAAQSRATGNMLTYVRDQPLVAFGIFATLFVIGYGVYVYMELNPGLFVKPPARPAPGAPLVEQRAPAPASAPAPAPASITGSPVPAPPPSVPVVSLLPPRQEIAGQEKAAAPVARRAETQSAGTVTAPAPVLPAPVPATPRDAIKVTSGSTTPTVNPLLTEAYGALAGGNFDSSRQLYSQVLKGDPGNVEALLGLASISTQQGDGDAATRQYVRVLEIDPRNTLAQAGLIGIVGRADPQAAETRVKQLIAREPSAAYLHFTLGNTYVDQLRWPDAQQAYFQAFHLQPDNPDYAYNLAVALEHIGQARPALDYYRRAVQLATVKGRANFSIAAARERAAKLEKVVQ